MNDDYRQYSSFGAQAKPKLDKPEDPDVVYYRIISQALRSIQNVGGTPSEEALGLKQGAERLLDARETILKGKG